VNLMKNQPQTKQKSKLAQLSEHRAARAVIGLAALVLAYVFAAWAIDSGSLLDYAITLLFIIVGLRELAAAVRGTTRGTSEQ
jgi:uncharacterized membrane protein HdeD (DUF308 family)